MPGVIFDQEHFEDLFHKLNRSPINADYQDFSCRSSRCEMGKLRGDARGGGTSFSKLVWNEKGLTVVEEWSTLSADNFREKFLNILTAWFDVFPETLVIPQTYCVRVLMQPQNYKDSRIFLGDKILHIGDPMQTVFTKMPFKVGFTIACPRDTNGDKYIIETTINSWKDNSSVWIEVKTSSMGPPIKSNEVLIAAKRYDGCLTLLEKEVIPLLNQYDQKPRKENNGDKRDGSGKT